MHACMHVCGPARVYAPPPISAIKITFLPASPACCPHTALSAQTPTKNPLSQKIKWPPPLKKPQQTQAKPLTLQIPLRLP
ncbi:hypothetical protein BV22DRAFT_987852, partial [Leucogyrophana mollusca]